MKKTTFFLWFLFLFVAQFITGDVLGLNILLRACLFAVFLYLLYKKSGLTIEDIGLQNFSKKTFAWSVVICLLVYSVLGLAYLLAPDVFLDQRYNTSLSRTLIASFVVLPLTTVILEELAFRGILLGYLLKTVSKNQSLILSSVLFGMWHLSSSLQVHVGAFMFINHPPQALVSLAIVVVTSIAGFGFSYLKLKTDSLLVPMVAHWSINSGAILLAWAAWNR